MPRLFWKKNQTEILFYLCLIDSLLVKIFSLVIMFCVGFGISVNLNYFSCSFTFDLLHLY